MRIIAGLARGIPLAAPRDAAVRPTSDRVRGAIFSSLGDRVAGASILDLFAGTGALGLEAASRGAQAVTFVEQDTGAVRVLEQNIAAVRRQPGWTCELTVLPARVTDAVPRLPGGYGLVLADPPYGPAAAELLADAALPGLLAADGLLVLESAKRDVLTMPAGWNLVREAVYGDTRVTYLRR